MIRVNNILVPLDFSDATQRTVNYGLSLALAFQARLVAAHVVSSLAAFTYTFPDETYDLEKRAYVEAKDKLPLQIPAEYRDKVTLKTVVKTGDVRDELLGIIREEDVDLVVMGTHGRRRLARFFLGSTTETVLRMISVPVVTVSRLDPGREIHNPAPIPIRRIVYATDFSEGSEVGLRYAAEVARTFKSELILLHALDTRELRAYDFTSGDPAGSAAARQKAIQKLRKAADDERTDDMNIELAAVEGVAHKAIVQFAEERDAELIVLNLRNKGVLERAMLGSTAERVIRSATVPVLSIPLREAAQG
jgi:nucleotide-binding universal stress UspA family protein